MSDPETARAAAREVRKKLMGLGYDIRLVDPMDFNAVPTVKTDDLTKEKGKR